MKTIRNDVFFHAKNVFEMFSEKLVLILRTQFGNLVQKNILANKLRCFVKKWGKKIENRK